MNFEVIQGVCVYVLPVIFAITVPKATRGYVARYFGDSTAFLAGRITLNPLRHLDPVGSVLVPMSLLLFALSSGLPPLLFGWSKPVPVNFSKLRDPKKDMLWVSLAGPASNFAMAVAWACLLKLLELAGVDEAFLVLMARAGIIVNIGFMVLNLLPIPPLDGGRIVASLLPPRMAWRYAKLEPFGIWILVLLLIFPPGRQLLLGVLAPVFSAIVAFLNLIFHF